MFDRIVVPLDGRPEGRDVLKVAEQLADRWGTSLELLSLVTESESASRRFAAVEQQAQDLHREHGTIVAERRSFVAPSAIKTSAIDERTLVVMGTTARNRSESFYGSVAGHFLSELHQPVLLVGPNATIGDGWPVGPLEVCSDGSDLSDEIVPAAREWAQALGLVPWAITVAELNDGHLAGLESNHVSRLAKQLVVGGSPPAYDVLHGTSPAKAIVDYARVHGASMIAMATHGRTGLRRLALGSVAMAVVHDAHCPVLVFNPPPAAPFDERGAHEVPTDESPASAPSSEHLDQPPASHFTVAVRRHNVVVHLEDAPTRAAAEALRRRYESRGGVEVDITKEFAPWTTNLAAQTRGIVEQLQQKPDPGTGGSMTILPRPARPPAPEPNVARDSDLRIDDDSLAESSIDPRECAYLLSLLPPEDESTEAESEDRP